MRIWIIGSIPLLALLLYGMWKAMVFDIECGDIVTMLNDKIDRLEAELFYYRNFGLDKF